MSIPGLSGDEEAAFRAAVRAPGARTFMRAEVLNLDHKVIGPLSVSGGQVRWNRGADVATEATIESADDRDARDLDLRNLVRVGMGIRTSLGVLWYPPITGWVVGVTDAGSSSEFTLHDKSAIGLVARRRQRFGPNRYVGDVVREAFEAIGETRFDIPRRWREGGPKLGRTVLMGGHDPEKAPTRMVKRLARKHGFQFFYRGDYCTWRRPPGRPSVQWEDGDDSDAKLLGEVVFNRDLTTIRNKVVAKGRKQLNFVNRDRNDRGPDDRGPDWRRLERPVELERGHAYSPHSLRRGGVGLELSHWMDADTVDGAWDLRNAAEDTLRKLARDRADVQLRSSAVPWLSPFDLLSARRPEGAFQDFWMQTGSMELDWSELTVGYQVDYRRKLRRRRG